ncbi:uncharacterized protein LOC115230243 [Octopus sinensis]|uniref:Uncharacterized protein LOC115230243 n=1 Tax=Octopus sinensis TaxID=2607531 RepID=A0A6P7TVE6_9MOLL|nr:uncharacterized protein LOC115230243 [Octopus sinensis]
METNKQVQPKIINLSKKILSSIQIKILARGLKFIPTPRRSNPNEIKDNTLDFCRKLRLTEALYNYTTEDDSIVKDKSEYHPTTGRNKGLDVFCDHITCFLYNTIPKQHIKSNLNLNEWKDLVELKNDINLTIKEADKGSAVVLMDTEYYKNLILPCWKIILTMKN